MKKVISMLLVVVLACSLVPTAIAADFDYQKVLGSRSNYQYDKFEKSWYYYESYVEKFSDARIIIGMDVQGETNGNNPSLSTLYIKILDNNGNIIDTVTSLAFLIGDDLYSYDTIPDMDTSSATCLGEQAQLLIKALAECKPSEVAVKIGTTKANVPLDLDSTEFANSLQSFCKVYIEGKIWDYTIEKELSNNYESLFPLTVNGTPASKLLEEKAA